MFEVVCIQNFSFDKSLTLLSIKWNTMVTIFILFLKSKYSKNK
jgi:hypothetical protein